MNVYFLTKLLNFLGNGFMGIVYFFDFRSKIC